MRTIDKGKGAWRKGIAAVAAIPMVFTLMTAGTAGAAEVDSSIQPATSDTNKVLDLGFDGNLTDNSAAANTVTEYKGTATYVDGVDGKAITLSQGALSLGASQKLQPESLSLSFWWNPSKTMTGEQILMWGKGKYRRLRLRPAARIQPVRQARGCLPCEHVDPCDGHVRCQDQDREVLHQW